jgi:hypothetical protein
MVAQMSYLIANSRPTMLVINVDPFRRVDTVLRRIDELFGGFTSGAGIGNAFLAVIHPAALHQA